MRVSHIVYKFQAKLRGICFSTLPRLVSRYDSTFQLSLTFHFPRNVNCMLYRLLRLLPQLIRQLLRFLTPLLDLWVRPFKVERQVEVCLILALGDGIVDEGACVQVAEVDLRREELSAWVESMKRGEVVDEDSWTYLPRSTNVQFFGNLPAGWTHAFSEGHGSLHETIVLLNDLAGRYGSDEKLGLAALDLHGFPEFGKCEEGGGIGGIDGVGLGLVEVDHGSVAVGCKLAGRDECRKRILGSSRCFWSAKTRWSIVVE